jgi:hypothetical protein
MNKAEVGTDAAGVRDKLGPLRPIERIVQQVDPGRVAESRHRRADHVKRPDGNVFQLELVGQLGGSPSDGDGVSETASQQVLRGGFDEGASQRDRRPRRLQPPNGARDEQPCFVDSSGAPVDVGQPTFPRSERQLIAGVHEKSAASSPAATASSMFSMCMHARA